jgi:hypothetical protein
MADETIPPTGQTGEYPTPKEISDIVGKSLGVFYSDYAETVVIGANSLSLISNDGARNDIQGKIKSVKFAKDPDVNQLFLTVEMECEYDAVQINKQTGEKKNVKVNGLWQFTINAKLETTNVNGKPADHFMVHVQPKLLQRLEKPQPSAVSATPVKTDAAKPAEASQVVQKR